MTKEQLQKLREKIILLNHQDSKDVSWIIENYGRYHGHDGKDHVWKYHITIGRVLYAVDALYCDNGLATPCTIRGKQHKVLDLWWLNVEGREGVLEDQCKEQQERLYDLFCNQKLR